MNLSIDGKNLEVTSIFRLYIQKKIEGLKKFVRNADARVELERDPHHHTGLVYHVGINLTAGGMIVHAEVRAADAYAAIDLLIPKLKEQIERFRGKKITALRRKPRKSRRPRAMAHLG